MFNAGLITLSKYGFCEMLEGDIMQDKNLSLQA